MKKYLMILLFLVILPNYSEAKELKVGDLFHITGCENKQLMVPVVSMWDKPGGQLEGARVVGKLSGNGRRDQGLKCQGAIVRLLEKENINGRVFLRIKSIVNSSVGWITDSFIGKKFSKRKCEKHFENPKHIQNCLGINEFSNKKKIVIVGVEGANLYVHPDHLKGFRKIRKGKELEVIESREFPSPMIINTWFYVEYKGDKGWISQHSLEDRPGKFFVKEKGEWVER